MTRYLPALLFLAALLPGTSEAATPGGPAEVRTIFERSCAECHDVARRSKPKGGFGFVLDLARLARDPDYVIPGDPDKSGLYLVLVDSDPDVVMPPPGSTVPKLSQQEREAVRKWIASLAAPGPAARPSVAPEIPPPSPASSAVQATRPPKPAVPRPMPSMRTAFARTHPMIVHFPIALLILAAAVEWLGWLLGRTNDWQAAVRWCVGVSALAALFAVATGWQLVGVEGLKPQAVFDHRWLGVSTAAFSLLSWALLEAAHRTGNSTLIWAARIVIGIAAALVCLTGHTGGELVYGEGYPF
jgi:uncharacterized membrane protein/mono/diheme cytochrome c family protein